MNDNIHTDNTETLRNALAENERLRAEDAVYVAKDRHER